ncbi:uncharacterized protein LOC143215581 [Lasioglossum baleicum]|uniref:uncharacterized protein LOC143215581 n=1 Tax=Lasioglossum baleicum TaxID=434251 RepID=UPI003FCEBDAA
MDLEDRIEMLLNMMTKEPVEGDDNYSEDSEFLDSSDQSETESETDKEDDTYSDTKSTKTDDNYYSRSFYLNKFFEDIDETKKYVTLNIENDTNDDILFDNKIYRVIPMKLDEIPKSTPKPTPKLTPKLTKPSNKYHKQCIARVPRQIKNKLGK